MLLILAWINMSTVMTIKECIESCEARRAENSRKYREAVRKTSESIRDYELQQAAMYKKAAEYYAK